MHAAGSWRLEGQGGESGLRKRSGLHHGPPHIITIYFLESVRGGRAISSPSPFLSSQPTPAERLDFGYQRFIQLRSQMSVKLQDNPCPLW